VVVGADVAVAAGTVVVAAAVVVETGTVVSVGEEPSGALRLVVGVSVSGCFLVEPPNARGMMMASAIAAAPISQGHRFLWLGVRGSVGARPLVGPSGGSTGVGRDAAAAESAKTRSESAYAIVEGAVGSDERGKAGSTSCLPSVRS
jgi:hypothetical protein